MPTCNICGSHRYRILYKEGVAQLHQIVKCKDCDLMYAYPLHKAAVKSYTNRAGQPAFTKNHFLVATHKVKSVDYAEIAPELEQYLPSKGHVLEIGCYIGAFLNHLKELGWDAAGCELNIRAAEYARENYGLNIYNQTIETLEAKNYYDAIVMLHVIEHMDDPAESLAVIHRLLRQDGIIVVETPTYDSLVFRLAGRRERSLSCDQHIYYFTVATLSRLLNKCGYEIVRSHKVGRTVSIGRLLWNLGVMSKNNAVKQKVDAMISRYDLGEKMKMHINTGDMVRMYCRRL